MRRSSQLFSGASRRKSRSSYGSAGTASRPRKRALARRAISPEEGRGVERRKAHRIPGSAGELRRRSLPPGIRRVRGGLESRTTPGTPHRCDIVRYRLANSLAPQKTKTKLISQARDLFADEGTSEAIVPQRSVVFSPVTGDLRLAAIRNAHVFQGPQVCDSPGSVAPATPKLDTIA